MSGKHIELFLVEGVPGGLTTAEIAGWTGHVLTGPRSDLAGVLRRAEAGRNGAYFLLGNNSEAIEGVECYIGRTESFTNRFRDHDAKKDFWDRVVLITAKDDAFNEGHWGYLESRLVDLARRAGRVTLNNGNTPLGRKLSEAQASDMEAFVVQLQIILPVLGVNVIRTPPSYEQGDALRSSISPIFTLRDTRRGVDARMQVDGNECIVLEGSLVVAEWKLRGTAESTKQAYAGLHARHQKLIADGSIVVADGVGKLARDVAFSSPSLAAAVVLGRSSNGRREWLWDGGTYQQWQDRGLNGPQGG